MDKSLKCINILLIEDDEVDIMTVKRAFKKANILNPVTTATNGLEGLDYLRGENGCEKIAQPLIILLDLNMPKMGGIEFLTVVKQDSELKTIPVVVLTSSSDEDDVLEAYGHSVAGYITKPVNVEGFVEKMAAVGQYWSLCEVIQE